MTRTVAYLDSSAFVKLVVAEPESGALARALSRWPDRVSSTLLRTEVVRALRRSGNERLVRDARRLFSSLTLIHVDEAVLDRAADLGPASLRSLDAIHLAAALTVGADLGALITYDERLRQAAEGWGLVVVSPA